MKNKNLNKIRLIIGAVITVTLVFISIFLGDKAIGGSTVELLIVLPISLVTYVLLSFDLYINMFKDFKKKRIFTEVTLSIIATIAAFATQNFVEGLAVIVFFQIGNAFEEYALNKSRKSIKSIMDLRPDKVTLYNDSVEKIVDPDDINVNDLILVKPGERVPLDGVLISDFTSLDTSSITGESLPKDVKKNDEIISGVINLTSPIVIKVTKPFYDSTISKILDLVENATNAKTAPEKFISKFSKIYTPVVIALAFLIAVIPPLFINYSDPATWSKFILMGASLLVISCPCSLVLSIPMAYFVGIGSASKVKALIKGSSFLESLNKMDALVLDKTGTITKGNFEVYSLSAANGHSNEELLSLARNAEYFSNHPIAKAIIGDSKDTLNEKDIKDYKVIDGNGVSVMYKNKVLLAGKKELMLSSRINFVANDDLGTIIYVSYDNEFIGSIVIRDAIKETSLKAINGLYKNGVKNVYMLTGDNDKIASSIAQTVGINNYYANLLPLDKTKILQEILSKNKMVAFAGDGVNDSPSISMANIGISMGGIGSDAAIEASDIVIMDDDLMTILKAKRISKATIRIVYENIFFSLFIKFGMMIITIVNSFVTFIPTNIIVWLAIFADVGVTIICVLNAFRLMLKKFN